MMRHLIGSLALAAVASVASAQTTSQPAAGDSAAHHMTAGKHKGTKKHHTASASHGKAMSHDSTKAAHHTATSGGEVNLDAGGPGYAPHAVARDWVRADDTKCDALCQRERKMDAMCGKDRDRCGKH